MAIDPTEQRVRLDQTGMVACEGNDPETGHPKVYYHLEAGQTVSCQYCGRVFVYEVPPEAPVQR